MPKTQNLPKATAEKIKSYLKDMTTVMPVPDPDVNARQEGGDHYLKKAIQPWDYITSNNLGYLEGNIVKYVSRWKDKGGRDDLLKARHYLEKLLESAI